MKYNFDEVINRVGTNASKWEPVFIEKAKGVKSEGVLPLWFADMDFKTPQAVIDALKTRANHGIFGYCEPFDKYYEALIGWYKKRYGWEINPEWVINTPGIVAALNVAVKSLTEPGDNVIVQHPVYGRFRQAVLKNNRVLLDNHLLYKNGKYLIDYDDLEEKAKNPKTKLILLCSPHNPVGRVWTKEELNKLGEICNKHNVIVLSDEIHSDLILPGNEFTTYALLGEVFTNNAIICTSPTKTFNLAGLQTSNIIIPNKEIREKFNSQVKNVYFHCPNIFGIVASTAAYSQEGEEWLSQLLDYLEGNADFIGNFLKEKLPKVKYTKPEATYLAWLDFSEIASDSKELDRKIKEDAKVLLVDGTSFGCNDEVFMRVNFACPRSILEEAMTRIEKVLNK